MIAESTMLRRFALSASAALLILAVPSFCLAMGMETFGNAPVIKQPEWAEGVLEVVNLKSRVYSQWVNGNENFFYRGNTAALNEALRKFAAVKADERELRLLPGPGKATTFQHKIVDCDWQFHVPSGIYRAMSKRKHATLTVYVTWVGRSGGLDKKQVQGWITGLDSDTFAVREQATKELEKLGYSVKQELKEVLQNQPSKETRRRLESLLEKLQGIDLAELEVPKGLTVIDAEQLIEKNLRELKNTDSNLAGLAVGELYRLAAYSDKVIPALIELLKKDQNEYVRRYAASVLSNLGAKARSALPSLREGLQDADANIRNSFQIAVDQLEKAKDAPDGETNAKKQRAVLERISEFRKGQAH